MRWPRCCVAWALFAALCFGTYAAGGADSFGYLRRRELFAQGRLTDTMPRHEGFDWPDVPATLTPLAYTRNAVPDVLVPVYPPGLSLMMAPLTLIHRERGVPAGAVVRRVDRVAARSCSGASSAEPAAGVLGALLVAASPTFLLQAAQPMSDVPVAALLALRPAPRAPAVDRLRRFSPASSRRWPSSCGRTWRRWCCSSPRRAPPCGARPIARPSRLRA